MLFDEFMAGTGCKDNADNYKIYRDLEILYMNSDLTKQQIYEYGKKLVNNSLTAEQVAWNADLEAKIKETKERIEEFKRTIALDEENYEYWRVYDPEYAKLLKRTIASEKKTIKGYRQYIRQLKDCMYTE